MKAYAREEKEKKIGEELKKNGLVKDKEFNLIYNNHYQLDF